MAFRKRLTALAVLVLALGLITTASAQQAFQCTANAGVPPLVRGEGLTELVGDIVLNCTGGTSTATTTTIPQANISIFLNTAVTSRKIGSFSEALLLIDEPSAGQQVLCNSGSGCATAGTGGNPAGFKAAGVANVYQGVVSGNSVTFIGVPVEPPGSTGARVYRITNIRANASALFTGAAVPNQIVALISATPATGPTGLTSSFPINNPQQIVGFVTTGLTFDVRDVANKSTVTVDVAAGVFQQCQSASSSSGNGVLLRYQEGFATSFRPRTIATTSSIDVSPAPIAQATPGLIYNSESGLYNPSISSTAGLADFGTRLKATFSNIPAGVSLWVSLTNVTVSGSGTISSATASSSSLARLIGVGGEAGTFFPQTKTDTIAGTDMALVNLGTTGTATTVWEVLTSQPLSTESFLFRVILAFSANPSANSPATGSALVAGSFAPTPPVFSASDGATSSATLPIPRFIDTGKGINFFRIAQCRSILLFPFVTNQAGFDTGVAISNTTTDPFGTAAQNGSCDLSFFGANAPAVVNTGTINSGTTYAAVASTIAPNFQGYVFAVCGFQMAHGFAFVSDIGARNLAMGYLALVVPDGVGRPVGVTLPAGATGELLGQ